MGLTHEPTKHALDLDGRRLYVWCALDAVGIPVALGRSARIMSTTADERHAVTIEQHDARFSPNVPLVVTVPLPDDGSRIIDATCPAIQFHRPQDAPRHPQALALTLDEAAELGRIIWGPP